MFPRFHRRSAFSARCLYEQRVARAWRCFAVVTAALAAGVAAFFVCPNMGATYCLGGMQFEGVPYAEPAPQTEEHPPVARPALRVEAPVAEPLAAAPALARPAVLPMETPELLWEAVTEEAEPFTLSEDWPEEPVAAAAPRRTSAPSRPPVAAAAPAPRSADSGAPARRTPPAYRSAPRPPYPAAMRQRRCTGSVGVRISVSAEGRPTAVEITTSAGYPEFDRVTRDWILQHWRFHPATEDGTPTASTVRTRVEFQWN